MKRLRSYIIQTLTSVIFFIYLFLGISEKKVHIGEDCTGNEIYFVFDTLVTVPQSNRVILMDVQNALGFIKTNPDAGLKHYDNVRELTCRENNAFGRDIRMNRLQYYLVKNNMHTWEPSRVEDYFINQAKPNYLIFMFITLILLGINILIGHWEYKNGSRLSFLLSLFLTVVFIIIFLYGIVIIFNMNRMVNGFELKNILLLGAFGLAAYSWAKIIEKI